MPLYTFFMSISIFKNTGQWRKIHNNFTFVFVFNQIKQTSEKEMFELVRLVWNWNIFSQRPKLNKHLSDPHIHVTMLYFLVGLCFCCFPLKDLYIFFVVKIDIYTNIFNFLLSLNMRLNMNSSVYIP